MANETYRVKYEVGGFEKVANSFDRIKEDWSESLKLNRKLNQETKRSSKRTTQPSTSRKQPAVKMSVDNKLLSKLDELIDQVKELEDEAIDLSLTMEKLRKGNVRGAAAGLVGSPIAKSVTGFFEGIGQQQSVAFMKGLKAGGFDLGGRSQRRGQAAATGLNFVNDFFNDLASTARDIVKAKGAFKDLKNNQVVKAAASFARAPGNVAARRVESYRIRRAAQQAGAEGMVVDTNQARVQADAAKELLRIEEEIAAAKKEGSEVSRKELKRLEQHKKVLGSFIEASRDNRFSQTGIQSVGFRDKKTNQLAGISAINIAEINDELMPVLAFLDFFDKDLKKVKAALKNATDTSEALGFGGKVAGFPENEQLKRFYARFGGQPGPEVAYRNSLLNTVLPGTRNRFAPLEFEIDEDTVAPLPDDVMGKLNYEMFTPAQQIFTFEGLKQLEERAQEAAKDLVSFDAKEFTDAIERFISAMDRISQAVSPSNAPKKADLRSRYEQSLRSQQTGGNARAIIPGFENLSVPGKRERISQFNSNLKQQARQFREAVRDGELQLSREIGESILQQAKAIRNLYDQLGDSATGIVGAGSLRSQKGYLTQLENEVIGGDARPGRSDIGLMQLFDRASQAGDDVSSGFIKGIEEDLARKAGQDLGEAAIEGARDALDSRSPSVAFIRIGQDVVKGFEIGLKGIRQTIKDSIQKPIEQESKDKELISRLLGSLSDLNARFPILGKLGKAIGALGIAAAGAVGLFSLSDAVIRFANESFEASVEAERLERRIIALSGSAEQGAENLSFIRNAANDLRIGLRGAEEAYSQLLATTRGGALEGAQTELLAATFLETASARGLSNRDTSAFFRAINQSIQKGRLTAEEVRGQLGDIPGLNFQQAAQTALGLNSSQFEDQLRSGQLQTSEVLPKIAAQLAAENASLSSASDTAAQSLTRVQNAYLTLQREVGAKSLPLQKIGLGLLASTLETIPPIISGVIDGVRLLIALLAAKFVTAMQGGAASTGLFGTAMTLTGNAATFLLKRLAVLLPSIARLAGQLALVFAATKVWGVVIGGLSDQFPELTAGIDEATAGIERLAKKLDEAAAAGTNLQKNLPTDGSGLTSTNFVDDIIKGLNRIPGLNLKTFTEARSTRFTGRLGDLATQTNRLTGFGDETSGLLRDIVDLDEQLRQLAVERGGLGSNDQAAREASIEKERELLAKRDDLLGATAEYQAQLTAQSQLVEKAQQELDRAIAENRVTASEADRQQAIINQLANQLEQAAEDTERISSALSESLTVTQRALNEVSQQVAGFEERQGVEQSRQRTRIIDRGLREGLSRREIGNSLEELELKNLANTVKEYESALGRVNRELEDDRIASAIKTIKERADVVDLNSQTISELLNNDEITGEYRTALEVLQRQIELQGKLVDAEEGLAQARLDATDDLEVFNKVLRKVNESLANFDAEQQRQSDRQRSQTIRRGLEEGLTPEQIETELDRADQRQLQARLDFVRARVSELEAELSNAGNQEILTQFRERARQEGTELRDATLDRFLEDDDLSDDERFALENLRRLQQLRGEVVSQQAQISDRALQTRRSLQDLSETVEDYFKGLDRQLLDAQAELSRKLQELTSARLSGIFSGIGTPGANTFVTGITQRIQGLLDKGAEFVERAFGRQIARFEAQSDADRLKQEYREFAQNLETANQQLEEFASQLRQAGLDAVQAQRAISGIGSEQAATGGPETDEIIKAREQAQAVQAEIDAQLQRNYLRELQRERQAIERQMLEQSRQTQRRIENLQRQSANLFDQFLPKSAADQLASRLSQVEDTYRNFRDTLGDAQRAFKDEMAAMQQVIQATPEIIRAIQQNGQSPEIQAAQIKLAETTASAFRSQLQQTSDQLGNIFSMETQINAQRMAALEMVNRLGKLDIERERLNKNQLDLQARQDIFTRRGTLDQQMQVAMAQERLKLEQQLNQLQRDFINDPEFIESQSRRLRQLFGIAEMDVQRDFRRQQQQAGFALEQQRLNRFGVEVNRLNATGQIFKAQEVAKQNALLQENLRFRQEIFSLEQQYANQPGMLRLMREEAELLNQANLEQIEVQFKSIGETILALVPTSAFDNVFAFLEGAKSAGDALLDTLRNITKSILRLSLSAVFNSAFGKFSGPFGGGIGGFADGGTVRKSSPGIVAAMAASSPAVAKALRKEGAGGTIIAAQVGEEILARGGEAESYRYLEQLFGDDPLTTLANYRGGGSVGDGLLASMPSRRSAGSSVSMPSAGGGSGMRSQTIVNAPVVVYAQDANSFRESRNQIEADRWEMIRRQGGN